MVNAALFSSNTDEWATPQNIFDSLNAEFSFNLDVCATANNHKCERYYTQEQDGLKQMWGGIESTVTRLIVILLAGLKRLTTRALSLIL